MEQFSLEKYLENQSRKVVTRDGRLVRIICTDVISHFPIVAAIKLEVGNEFIQEYDLKGRASLSKNEDCDLFFADVGEELTEFEKELKAMIQDIERGDFTDESFDFCKGRLLDLARNELQSEIDKASKLKSEMPCTFYGKVRFHGEDAEAEYLCCLCSQKKAMELAKNDAFDENIFYYYESISEIEESIFGNGDFVLLDIDLNSVEKVEL